MVYEGAPEKHLKSIAQTLIARLQENRRCVYLNSPAMISAMHRQMYAEGFNVSDHISRGALIMSSERDHLVDGRFDLTLMLKSLRETLRAARKDGFDGLWASGDMTWEFGSENNLDKLEEYERKLDNFVEDHPAMSGVCLYHRATLPPHALATALATHRSVYVSEKRSWWNPWYLVPKVQFS